MNFKKLLIIGFLLITLVALPVSFAADIDSTDLNSNDMGGNLGLEEGSQSLSSEISSTSVEDEDNFNNLSLSNNDTIYLNSSYTGTVENGTLTNPYKNINSAITSLLNSNKTNLFIADGTYTINSHFNVNKNVNIIGESTSGVKINCNRDYLFAFRNCSSNIYNLTIYNAYSNSEYAVIWTELSNITMCNVVFTNNLANSPGGIILTQKGTFKLINCSIKNSLIDYGDGGISGGIIYSEGTDLRIVNSSFNNNTIKCTTYYGGAIFANGKLEFINSTFSKLYVNSAEVIQGAFIYYGQSNNTDYAYIINSSFEKSNFNLVSGLILTDARNCIINNTNISDNYANTLQGNISVLDLYYASSVENLNIFNNTYNDVSIDLSTVMNFLYRNGYFIISEALPDSYDLRDYNLTTIAKNQNPSGSCWAFATISALESYLLKYWNESFDLSENNMKNIMGKYGINGSEWDTNNGGNDVLALAYLLRWSGAVNESDDPFNPYSTYSDIYDAVCHVQDVIYIPLRLNYTDNDQIKYAIMNYGAVFTEMHANDGVIQKNTYSAERRGSDHAVAIVGWDDNYSASNFAITPPGDGAFIVKNSWGPNWGDGGYFYVSYYDASFAGFANTSKFSGFVFANVEDVDNYNNIYYYDPFGNDYVAAGYLSNTGWFANQFVSNNNEILSAFGIYTYGDSNYSVNIYINNNLVYTQDGSISNSGYHTIKLNQQLGLNKGDIFKIEVKLTTPNCLYPIAVEVPHMGEKPFVNATANPNESFVSVDGVNWNDLTELIGNANVCIKSYTVNPTYIIEANATRIDAYVDDIITLKISVKDLSGITKNLSDGEIRVIFPDSTVVTPTLNNDEISFVIPDSNVSGNLVIGFKLDNCPEIFANLNLNLLKHTTHLDVSFNEIIHVGDSCRFVITITDENNNPISSGNIIIYEDGVKLAEFNLSDSTLIWNHSFTDYGEYKISIVYNENNKYARASVNKIIDVDRSETTLYLEPITASILSSVELVAHVNSNFSVYGNVTFYVSGTKIGTSEVKNGVAKYNYNCDSEGNFVIKAVFDENKKFKSSENTSNLIVNKIPVTITISQNNTYYKSAFITIKLSKAVNGQKIVLKFSNGETVTVTTNSKGIATYYVPYAVGSYKVNASASSNYYVFTPVKNKAITIKKVTATITAYALTTTYRSGKYFQVKVTNPAKQVMVGVKLRLLVYTGSKYSTVYITTGTNGIAKYSGSALSIAKHKIVVSNAESTSYMVAKSKTNYLTVKKATTTVTAPVVKNKYKANKYFKVTIKHNESGKVISGLVIKIRVYTGSKYTTYTVKTNSNGVAQLNTNVLSKGTHKVTISSGNAKYTVSKSGNLIVITS